MRMVATSLLMKMAIFTVSGSWVNLAGAADELYTWSWDLDGDRISEDNGDAS